MSQVKPRLAEGQVWVTQAESWPLAVRARVGLL